MNSRKLCSDQMAAIFMDFNDFGIYGMLMKQWSRKNNNLCQKLKGQLKILGKLRKIIWKISVINWLF